MLRSWTSFVKRDKCQNLTQKESDCKMSSNYLQWNIFAVGAQIFMVILKLKAFCFIIFKQLMITPTRCILTISKHVRLGFIRFMFSLWVLIIALNCLSIHCIVWNICFLTVTSMKCMMVQIFHKGDDMTVNHILPVAIPFLFWNRIKNRSFQNVKMINNMHLFTMQSNICF